MDRLSARVLQTAGTRAANALSKELGRGVRCEYLGQPYGPPAHRRYRREPSDWRVPAGEWRSQQTVAFAWVFDGDEEHPHFTEQRCDNVLARGVHAPDDIPGVTVQNLETAATSAAIALGEEIGLGVRCEYLGQPYGPSQHRRHRRKPSDWRVPADERRSQQTVAFAWIFYGEQEHTHFTEQLCNHVLARGVRPPETIMGNYRGADTLWQGLEKAAAAAEEARAAAMLEEFGVRLRCKCPCDEGRS